MLVSCLGFFDGLSGLLLCADMVVSAVLLRGGPVGFRGLFVMFIHGAGIRLSPDTSLEMRRLGFEVVWSRRHVELSHFSTAAQR